MSHHRSQDEIGFLHRQGFHLLAAVVSAVVLAWAANFDSLSSGALWGRTTRVWYELAVAVPIVHQAYVMVVWRWQLVAHGPTRLLGAIAFPLYGVGFMLFFALRLVTVVLLAISNGGSLAMPRALATALGILISVPSLYVLYSVVRYFGLPRAMGADHFDPAFRKRGLERRGAFRFVPNAMYVAGLMGHYLPGLIWGSSAALLLGAFNHAYVWVHFLSVEKPDMQVIYGSHTGNG